MELPKSNTVSLSLVYHCFQADYLVYSSVKRSFEKAGFVIDTGQVLPGCWGLSSFHLDILFTFTFALAGCGRCNENKRLSFFLKSTSQ